MKAHLPISFIDLNLEQPYLYSNITVDDNIQLRLVTIYAVFISKLIPFSLFSVQLLLDLNFLTSCARVKFQYTWFFLLKTGEAP